MPPSADAPINLAPSRIAALWPIFAALIAVAVAAGMALANVTQAQARADEAYTKANGAVEAMHLIDVRLERIQTVVERLDKSR